MSLVTLDFRLFGTSQVGPKVCPSVELRQLMGNGPEANQQVTLLSKEELTSCSPRLCPSSAGL